MCIFNAKCAYPIQKWEKGMSVFCKPFTTAKIRYFDKAQAADARTWLDQTNPQ
jgi:hypothetical protein